jgi:hypothetical protein
MEYSAFTPPKPTSFWHLCILNQVAHPTTDQDMSVWTDWLKMGPSGSAMGAPTLGVPPPLPCFALWAPGWA